MAITTLPNDTTARNYRFRVELSGVVFSLRFYFNRRSARWFVDIRDNNEVLLRAGLKLVADFPILSGWVEQIRPAGELMVINQASDTDPGADDLGIRSLVAYDDRLG